MNVRAAGHEDLPRILEIYNHEVLVSTATYDTVPRTPAEHRKWFSLHGTDHPVLVADAGSAIAGWASLSPWSDRAAYAKAVEVSVYVAEEYRRQGVGAPAAGARRRRAIARVPCAPRPDFSGQRSEHPPSRGAGVRCRRNTARGRGKVRPDAGRRDHGDAHLSLTGQRGSNPLNASNSYSFSNPGTGFRPLAGISMPKARQMAPCVRCPILSEVNPRPASSRINHG